MEAPFVCVYHVDGGVELLSETPVSMVSVVVAGTVASHLIFKSGGADVP